MVHVDRNIDTNVNYKKKILDQKFAFHGFF